MKVFISWSGDRSRHIAGAFREWIKKPLPFADPYFSQRDTDKGARWEEVVMSQLKRADAGIFILTPKSLESDWLHFEAGALAVRKAPVCSVLFGVNKADVKGPLQNFQMTEFTKEDIGSLLATLNRSAGANTLPESTLMDVLDKRWPELENGIDKLPSSEEVQPAPRYSRKPWRFELSVGMTSFGDLEDYEMMQIQDRIRIFYPDATFSEPEPRRLHVSFTTPRDVITLHRPEETLRMVPGVGMVRPLHY